MSVLWKNHADHLHMLINNNNETQAHLYLEQLLLFPVNIQDKIIEDISQLNHCNKDEISGIIDHYTLSEMTKYN